MGLFIFRFWPALLPLIMYVLWWATVGRKPKKTGLPAPRFRDGPWYWLVIATLVMGMLCFIVLGTAIEDTTGTYIPPHMEQGAIVPGKVEPKP